VALLMRLSGDRTVRVGALLSTVASLVALLLCVGLAVRMFGVWPGLVALLFLAASPLDLAMARRAWVDPLLGALTVGMICASARLLGRPERLVALVVFLVLGAWGLLVKESGAIALSAGCVGLAFHAWQTRRSLALAARPLLGGLTALALAAALLVWLSGGIQPLVQVYRPMPGSPVSEYLARYDSGGPGYYVVGLLLLQPVPFVLGVLGALMVILRVRLGAAFPAGEEAQRLVTALAWFLALFLVTLMTQHPKNMRLLAPVLVPLYLLAATLVCALLSELRRRLRPSLGWGVTAAAGGALGLAAFLDVDRFVHYFIVSGVPDLATPWLLQVP